MKNSIYGGIRFAHFPGPPSRSLERFPEPLMLLFWGARELGAPEMRFYVRFSNGK